MSKKKFTQVELKVIDVLINSRGHLANLEKTNYLYQFASDYKYLRKCIANLEDERILIVERKTKGTPMKLSLSIELLIFLAKIRKGNK